MVLLVCGRMMVVDARGATEMIRECSLRGGGVGVIKWGDDEGDRNVKGGNANEWLWKHAISASEFGP